MKEDPFESWDPFPTLQKLRGGGNGPMAGWRGCGGYAVFDKRQSKGESRVEWRPRKADQGGPFLPDYTALLHLKRGQVKGRHQFGGWLHTQLPGPPDRKKKKRFLVQL